jgi:hypothetical protein
MSSGKKPGTPISSLYTLITATVSVTTGTGRNQKTITLPSPLADPSQVRTLLPMVLDKCTTTKDADLAPRININTAPQAVLQTLITQASNQSTTTSTTTTGSTGQTTTVVQAQTQPKGLTDADIQTILSKRPSYASDQSPDPIYNTPAWLITEANLSPTAVQAVSSFITCRSGVYRFQVLGYFEGGGAATRLEAVVDTNFKRPRILYIRDITELGKGFDLSKPQ